MALHVSDEVSHVTVLKRSATLHPGRGVRCERGLCREMVTTTREKEEGIIVLKHTCSMHVFGFRAWLRYRVEFLARQLSRGEGVALCRDDTVKFFCMQ